MILEKTGENFGEFWRSLEKPEILIETSGENWRKS